MEMTLGRTADEASFERKAWRRVFEDGLFDLFLAIAFLNAAGWMAAAELDLAYGETAVPAGGVLIVALLLFRFLKERVTVPRLGHFRIQRKRTSKLRLGGFLAVGLLVSMVGVTFAAGAGAFETGVSFPVVLFGLLALKAVVLFSLGAYFTGVSRFYFYGALAAAGMAGAQIAIAVFGAAQGWSVVGICGLPALAMIPTGAVLLKRFVRAYPVGGRVADGR
jgi:hypothetical protein